MNRKDTAIRQLIAARIIAVVRERQPDDAARIIDVLSGVGITTIEITLTTPSAHDLIAQFSAREDLLVGAGSVLTPQDMILALEAGASFYASPCFDPSVQTIAAQSECVSMPGALTPNEIHSAWRGGGDFVKLFPVPSNGPAYIRSILGPMPHLRLAPSGGITGSNAIEFLRSGATVLNVGSWLTPRHEETETRLMMVRERGTELVHRLASMQG